MQKREKRVLNPLGSAKRKDLGLCVLALCLLCLPYVQLFSVSPFLDDLQFYYPERNKTLTRYDAKVWWHDFTVTYFNTESTPEIPTDKKESFYRPLTHGYYRVQYALGQKLGDPFHGPMVVNLFLQWLGTCLLFWKCRKLFGEPAALLAAAFYLCHPVITSVITFRAASIDTLVHTMMLGALVTLPDKESRWRAWLPCWMFSLLAVFTKEFGLFVWPMLLVLMNKRLLREWRYLLPCTLGVVVYLSMRMHIAHGVPMGLDNPGLEFKHKLMVPLVVCGAYLEAFIKFGVANLVCPLDLYYGKGVLVSANPFDEWPKFFFGGLAWVVFFFISLRLWQKNKKFLQWFWVFLFTLAPGVLVFTYDRGYEQFLLLYMDHQGQPQAAALALALAFALRKVSYKKICVLSAVLLMCWGARTFMRVAELQKPHGTEMYYKSAVDHQCADSRMYANLSNWYFKEARDLEKTAQTLQSKGKLKEATLALTLAREKYKLGAAVDQKAQAEGRVVYWNTLDLP